MAKFIPTVGFLPDVDPTTPGVITTCNGFIPSKFGMRSAYSAASRGYSLLPAAAQSFVATRKTDGSVRIIAGAASKLYELSGTSWADVTRTVGGNYASTNRWRFGQFGDVTIAVDQFDTPQTSSSGAFADLAAMPKARVIDTVNQFVIIAATNEGTYGNQTDRWWCSALGDYTNWTPAIATQCATGRLYDTPGEITALRTINEAVAVYKQRSLYLGTYGLPAIWNFRLVSTSVGAWSQEAVVKVGYSHYFIGYEDFYFFDGTVPVPIGDGIKFWFFNDLNRTQGSLISGFYDRLNDLIYWFYPSSSSSTLDSYVVYQPSTKRWGAARLGVEAVGEFLTPAITYDTFGVGLTYDTLPNVVYDSAYWSQSAPSPAVFDTTHQLSSLSGVSGSSSATFGWNGDDQEMTLIRRVIPRWKIAPTSATLTHTYTNALGGTTSSDSAVSMDSSKRFDFMRTARWHQEQLSTTGDCEFSGLAIDGVSAGTE